MPTDADFLAAIIEDPESDGPRLIYADWLEETGDEARAEFIRLQCSVAGAPESELESNPIIERTATLLSQNYDRWTLPLNRILFPGGEAEWWQPIRSVLSRAADVLRFGPYWWNDRYVNRLLGRNWHFRRGFAQKLRVRSAALLPAAAEIVRRTPLHSLVVQLDEPHGLSDVTRLEHWRSLRSLSVFGNGGPPVGLQEALDSSSVASVHRLGLHNLSFIRSDLDSLAASEMLGRLERLTLVASLPGGGERLELLLGNLPTVILRRLTLNNLWAENQAQSVLDQIPAMGKLTHLDLASNPIGDADLGPLLERLPALTHLSLAATGLSDVGLRSMLRSERLRQLRFLNLSETAIPDQGALDLADSPNLVGTTRINLRGVTLSDPVRRALLYRLEGRVLL
jgi:uncharacterized protein (TIGR02996 family)